MNTLSPMRSQPSALNGAPPHKLTLEHLASAHVGGEHLSRLDLLRVVCGDVAIEDDEVRQHARRAPAHDPRNRPEDRHSADNTADEKAPEWAMPKNSSLYD